MEPDDLRTFAENELGLYLNFDTTSKQLVGQLLKTGLLKVVPD